MSEFVDKTNVKREMPRFAPLRPKRRPPGPREITAGVAAQRYRPFGGPSPDEITAMHGPLVRTEANPTKTPDWKSPEQLAAITEGLREAALPKPREIATALVAQLSAKIDALALSNEAAAATGSALLSDTLIALDQRASARGSLSAADVTAITQAVIDAMPKPAPAHQVPAVSVLTWGTTNIPANSALGVHIAADKTNFAVAGTGLVKVRSGGKAKDFAKTLRTKLEQQFDFSTGEARGGAAAQGINTLPKKGLAVMPKPKKDQDGSGHYMRRKIPATRRR